MLFADHKVMSLEGTGSLTLYKADSDPELDLVYYLFYRHNWTPEMYYGMEQGGRDLTWALASWEAEHSKK